MVLTLVFKNYSSQCSVSCLVHTIGLDKQSLSHIFWLHSWVSLFVPKVDILPFYFLTSCLLLPPVTGSFFIVSRISGVKRGVCSQINHFPEDADFDHDGAEYVLRKSAPALQSMNDNAERGLARNNGQIRAHSPEATCTLTQHVWPPKSKSSFLTSARTLYFPQVQLEEVYFNTVQLHKHGIITWAWPKASANVGVTGKFSVLSVVVLHLCVHPTPYDDKRMSLVTTWWHV